MADHGSGPHPLRELLFGDVPLARWAGDPDPEPASTVEPWASLRAAATALDADDPDLARTALTGVLAQPDLESRHYLQAWHALRTLGVTPPPEQAKHLYGIVLDVPMDGGLDTLAVYEDHHCRYLNHGGGAIIWEQPDAAIDPLIEDFLGTGRALVPLIGPWEDARPPLPPGQARLSLLCPSGIHFGQGALRVLQADPRAQALIGAGSHLLAALVERAT